MVRRPGGTLRRGWTTGACATAAARAAYEALVTGHFPDPVAIALPGGERPAFALAREERGADFARAAVIKDAGDDPDVTHGAMIVATVRRGAAQSGVTFAAGPGVGTVTKPGLPLAVGEPAINPVPRGMMRDAIDEAARALGASADIVIEISVPGGEDLAAKTWNPRLGILGGISILGTTGIVVPFSCAAWIHSIQRGIDVARATGLVHVAGCTGSTSERAAQKLYGLPPSAMLDMGDFAGGLLKYLRDHPLPRLTIAGGFAKITKLAAGHLDLHSGRSQVDMAWLADRLAEMGAGEDLLNGIRSANSALDVLEMASRHGFDIAKPVAALARTSALDVLRGSDVAVDVLVVDRHGQPLASSGA